MKAHELKEMAAVLRDMAADLEAFASELCMAKKEAAKETALPDLFAQIQEDYNDLCDAMPARTASPEWPGVAEDGTEIREIEGPRRTCRRLESKMLEAKTVRVAEPLGKKKGFYQRMNIEKMVVLRTGRSWDDVRVVMNRAIEELQPVCYQGFTSEKIGKLCRFYLKNDRDRLIERAVELLKQSA